MKIQTLNQTYFNNTIRDKQKSFQTQPDLYKQDSEILNIFYYPLNINFHGAQAAIYKNLFKYKPPCMYTGITMMDSKTALDFLNSIYKLKAKEIFAFLEEWEASFLHPEFISRSGKDSYNIIKEQVEKTPEISLKEVFITLKPHYEKKLIKQQVAILEGLQAFAYGFPEEYVKDYKTVLSEAKNRMLGRPIKLEFSVKEFKYKLEQIKNEYATLKDKPSVKEINLLLKESKNFSSKNSKKTLKYQRKVIAKIESILNHSHLNRDEALQNLIEDAKLRLNDKKTLVPFTKKGFIHDLAKIVENIKDKDIKRAIMAIATKLPTSQDSSTSYIIKFASKPPDKYIYNLIWPIIATIEHLNPKSCGGAIDDVANFGGAAAKSNSDRHSLPFIEQIKRKPLTPQNSQKYLDWLIDLAYHGLLEKEGLDISCVEKYKKQVESQSQGIITLDSSRLYSTGKFKKPELA